MMVGVDKRQGDWTKRGFQRSEIDEGKDDCIKYSTREAQEHHDEPQLRKWASPALL